MKGFKLWSLVLCILCLANTVSAETVNKNDNPFIIKSIEIKGSKTMPPDTIIGMLQTRVGEEVSQKKLNEDVKELFKLGQFSNIMVDSSESMGGIKLTFILEEWPKVSGEVAINGNQEISSSKIKEVLTISANRSLGGKILKENKNKILSLYKQKGYYLAQVEPVVVTNPEDGSARVSFNINEGKKISVEEIDITGNRKISDRELRKQMKLKKGKRFDDAYFESDLKSIVEYYRQNGFVNARITRSEKELLEKSGFIIHIEVKEGPQFRIGKFDVTIEAPNKNKPLFSKKDILEELVLKEGDIFKEAVFYEDIMRIRKMYVDKGRVSTEIRQNIEYKDEEEIVDISLSIFEGEPAYIKTVPINWVSETSDEPHKTKEYVIRRELDRFDIKEGKLFSAANIEDARRKILTLGPFIKRALPRLVAEGNGQEVIVNFDIEESRQSGMFSIAGGYGSEGGLFGALDIWDDNIFGRAWRMQLRGEIGTRERRTGLISFSTPWIFNTPTSLNISLYNTRRSIRDYPSEYETGEKSWLRAENVGGSVTIGRPLSRKVELSVGLRNESVVYKELLGDTWVRTQKGTGKTRSIKFLIDRDTRNYLTSMFDPNSGSYNSFSIEYSGFGGDKFQKYLTESSLFIPTWWKLVLAIHLSTGYLAGKDTRELMLERFYLGGIDSVRGYEPYSITPPGDYAKYGGNQMALLNVEYRFPITDMLRGILFFDAGQAWGDNEYPWDNFRPRKSIGVGLRIDLLGALARIEYGYPLDPAREGEKVKGGKFQIDIGPAF